MNRTERRKHQNNITGKLTREEAHKALMTATMAAYKEAQADTVYRQILVMSVVLRDKFGWGHKRLDKLLDEMEELSDTVNKKRVKVSELHSIVVDELKLDIVKPKNVE